jgi:hypothetical protein
MRANKYVPSDYQIGARLKLVPFIGRLGSSAQGENGSEVGHVDSKLKGN